MSTKAVVATLLALAAPVAAQPAPPVPHTCDVRFVRAPDEVRYVIETWLAAEPRCSSAIDLRVIPTGHGFYLIAQRPDGRLHERYVPDAQSAGVLVASWVADDWVAPRTAPVSANVWNAPRPGAPPAAIPGTYVPHYTTPSETSAIKVTEPQAPRRTEHPRWLSLGVMIDTDRSADGGVSGELDVFSRGALTVGVSAAYSETSMRVYSSGGESQMRSDDHAATAYGAYTLRYGRWELRGALGAGVVYSQVDGFIDTNPGGWTPMQSFYASGAGVIGTASLLATMRLGERWGISAGLTSHVINEQITSNLDRDLQRTDSRMFFFTGLRRRI